MKMNLVYALNRFRIALGAAILFLPLSASAQFVCGSTNVFEKNVEWMRELARTVGFAVLVGDQEFQCGMPGEDFKLCRKCEKGLDGDQMSTLKPMFTREPFRRWVYRWNEEYKAGKVELSFSDFDSERRMGHARPDEAKSEYEDRIKRLWGESFLFMNRKVYQMVQLELTVSGKSCVGPLDQLPRKWNDKLWPAPRGGEVQPLLDKAHEEMRFLEEPKTLRAISLDRLGKELQSLSEQLSEIYRAPDSEIAKNCKGEELESRECDDLGSGISRNANRYAWMINSYIDSFIGKWMRARGIEEISSDCDGKPSCYEWQGRYTATYPF